MNIYIKKYLTNIPIIKKMVNLIKEYSQEFPSEEDDSYSEYRNIKASDDVITFLDYVVPSSLGMCNGDSVVGENDADEVRENKIVYLSELFYSVKGTYKVFDYITEYDLFQTNLQKTDNGYIQGQDTTSTITYTTQNVTINIESLPSQFDRELFCSYLEKFLCALIYFGSLTINIKKAGITYQDTSRAFLNHGEAFYQYYEV